MRIGEAMTNVRAAKCLKRMNSAARSGGEGVVGMEVDMVQACSRCLELGSFFLRDNSGYER